VVFPIPRICAADRPFYRPELCHNQTDPPHERGSWNGPTATAGALGPFLWAIGYADCPQAARITVAVAFNDAQSSALISDSCLIRDFEPPAPLGWGFSQVTKDLQMKGFIAACIAVSILWGVDVEMNDGRYSAVVKNAITSILPL
jgi:hypothetical protein